MTKHILRIRGVDRVVLDSVKNGTKTIETRAGTDKFRRVEVGDILVLVCEGEKLEKQVKKIEYFKSIDQMLKSIDYKKIMPHVDSEEQAKQVWHSFSGYKEKIKKVGLAAFWLE